MLRYFTSGESHGEALVAFLSGLPAGVPVDLAFIDHELWRRQQGFGRGGRMKIETDCAEVVTGVRHGQTIGSPIGMIIRNSDWKNWTETTRLAARARDHYGAPSEIKDGKETNEFRVLLNESGLGNHPVMIRMFRSIGADLSEENARVLRQQAVESGLPRDSYITTAPLTRE